MTLFCKRYEELLSRGIRQMFHVIFEQVRVCFESNNPRQTFGSRAGMAWCSAARGRYSTAE